MTVTETRKDFYVAPYRWLLLAIFLVCLPLSVLVWRLTGGTWHQAHPAYNAMLNGISTVFLLAGRWAIHHRRIEFHKACMISAFASSCVFLASYLTRYALSGTHRYPGEGWDKILYLVILFSHMLLAMVVVPMILLALYWAWKDNPTKHKKIARIAWPIWLYVSITGIVVYFMLYPIASRLMG